MSEPVASPVQLAVVESAPDSDATMLQALDAAAAPPTDEFAEDGDEGLGGPSDQLTSIDAFEKTLQSDVNENQALLLLRDVQPLDPVFQAFNDDDMERLARYLSVLSFGAGEQIISKGEPASFCGIVLDGCFNAVISETVNIPLAKGALVGEMSFYEGGKRSADIVSAEPSVLAVISFNDLRKLQPFEAELVQKFLHMLAVISIRKLRAMMPKTGGPTITVTPAKDASGATPSATPATAAPVVEKDNAQESLFKHRLKLKEAALSEKDAAIKEAERIAEAARKKHTIAQKKSQIQKYKAQSLESKLKTAEKDLEEMRLQEQKYKEAQVKAKQNAYMLTQQITAMTTQRQNMEQQVEHFKQEYLTAKQEKDEVTAKSALAVSSLESTVESLKKEGTLLKTNLDVENQKVRLLSQRMEESERRREHLEMDQKSLVRELETTRGSNMILTEKNANLDQLRREYLVKMNDEELAHISWKSKAELYLGDYTRLTARVKEMEALANVKATERRLILRRQAQMRSLMKHVVVRTFVRNVRTRRMIFAILQRLSSVMSSRGVHGGGGERDGFDPAHPHHSSAIGAGGTEDDPYSLLDDSLTQTVSLSQARKDRAKLLVYLKQDRTPVSKLIWLLDEELTNFEAPFHALQTENAQLRHTLDAFFKRNIQLCQQFLTAKTTYEALHKEYTRLREGYERLKRIQKLNGSQQPGGGMMTMHGRTGSQVMSLEDDDDDVLSGTHPISLPTPTPFSPSALQPLTFGQQASYAATFGSMPSPSDKSRQLDRYGQIALGGPRVIPAPIVSTKKKRFNVMAAESPISPGATDIYATPRPPSSAASGPSSPRVSSRPSSSPAHRPGSSSGLSQVSYSGGSAAGQQQAYDISSRSAGQDVASRSEALRQKIQASIYSKGVATPTHAPQQVQPFAPHAQAQWSPRTNAYQAIVHPHQHSPHPHQSAPSGYLRGTFSQASPMAASRPGGSPSYGQPLHSPYEEKQPRSSRSPSPMPSARHPQQPQFGAWN